MQLLFSFKRALDTILNRSLSCCISIYLSYLEGSINMVIILIFQGPGECWRYFIKAIPIKLIYLFIFFVEGLNLKFARRRFGSRRTIPNKSTTKNILIFGTLASSSSYSRSVSWESLSLIDLSLKKDPGHLSLPEVPYNHNLMLGLHCTNNSVAI